MLPPVMSCTPITAAMRQLLEALTAWPDADIEDLRRRPEWEQALAWGWVRAWVPVVAVGGALFWWAYLSLGAVLFDWTA